MKRHTNFTNEIEMNEPKDNSNLYVGIAVGVMITLCAIIYTVTNVLSVMY